MIREHDEVVLVADLPHLELRVGDIGVVVDVHAAGAAYEVEFMTLDGETLAVETLGAELVRPVGGNEVPHARALASHSAG